MKLFASVITSGVIIAAVWGLAIFQLPSANAISQTEKPLPSLAQRDKSAADKAANTLLPKKQKINASSLIKLNLTGVKKTIAFGDLPLLWQEFESSKDIQNSLKDHPEKVYVFYQNFSNNYQKAEVTIGYNSTQVRDVRPTTIIREARYKPILEKAQYSVFELANGWQNIDYTKQVKSVLEVHYLNNRGDTIASEVLVSYE